MYATIATYSCREKLEQNYGHFAHGWRAIINEIIFIMLPVVA